MSDNTKVRLFATCFFLDVLNSSKAVNKISSYTIQICIFIKNLWQFRYFLRKRVQNHGQKTVYSESQSALEWRARNAASVGRSPALIVSNKHICRPRAEKSCINFFLRPTTLFDTVQSYYWILNTTVNIYFFMTTYIQDDILKLSKHKECNWSWPCSLDFYNTIYKS